MPEERRPHLGFSPSINSSRSSKLTLVDEEPPVPLVVLLGLQANRLFNDLAHLIGDLPTDEGGDEFCDETHP